VAGYWPLEAVMAKKETRVQKLTLQRDKSGKFVNCLPCGQRINIQSERNTCGNCGAVVDGEGWMTELIENGESETAKAQPIGSYHETARQKVKRVERELAKGQGR
jgi:hypothetical protein